MNSGALSNSRALSKRATVLLAAAFWACSGDAPTAPREDSPPEVCIPDDVALVFTLLKSDAEGGLQGDIYGAGDDCTGFVNLTNHPAHESDPAWSPDGSRLVFARAHEHEDDLNFELYVVNLDGTGLTRLTDHDGFDGAPAWSPDGSQIAFQRSATAGRQFGAPHEIFIMNADGSDVRNLTNSEEHEAWPSWSPDGSRVVFERKVGDASMIFVMNADGSEQQRLSPEFAGGRLVDREPAWSPDGGMIAFRSLRDQTEGPGYEIWVMNADGTGLHRVLHLPGAEIHPAWISDGRILFIDVDTHTIFSVRPDGSDLRKVVESDLISWPKWRP